MCPACLQDFSRMFPGCSDGSRRPGGIWWSFQMKVWTLLTRRSSMIPNYSMIPAIRWSPAIQWSPDIRSSPAILWSPAIRWSIGSMDFDNPKVYGDTSITDGLDIMGPVCTGSDISAAVLSLGWRGLQDSSQSKKKQNSLYCFHCRVALMLFIYE